MAGNLNRVTGFFNVQELRPARVQLSPEVLQNIAVVRPTPQPIVRPEVVEALAKPKLQPIVPIADVRFFRPELGQRIAKVRPPAPGVPRGQITVPISKVDNVTDVMMFEAPADAAQQFYLPRYRVTVNNQQYQMSLAPSGDQWTLTIHLEKYPAAEIQEAARSAREITHTISVILTYRLSVGGSGEVQKELVFQEVVPEGAGVRAVLRVASRPEVDSLYYALTDPSNGATLVVRRAMNVAIPAPAPAPRPVPRPIPQVQPLRFRPKWGDEASIQDAVLAARVERVHADQIWAGDEPQEPSFREVTRVLDNKVAPDQFFFLPNLHGYIFGNLTPSSAQNFQLNRCQIGTHNYYQDPVRRNLFYYLPDSFKLARRPQSPRLPLLQVRFSPGANATAPEDLQAALSYVAIPVTDADRLEADALALKQRYLSQSPSDQASNPILEPLLVTDPNRVTFRVALPGGATEAGPYQERKGALIDLRSGIHDELILAMPNFSAVFNAVFGASTTLLNGQVQVTLGEGASAIVEVIPFAARMADTAGALFDCTETPDEGAGTVTAQLQNVIESPLRIRKVTAQLRRGQALAPAHVQNFTPPVDLAPQGQVTLTVTPAAPFPGNPPLQAVFDLDDVEVLPDRDAVWNAVVDPSTSEPERTIEVKTVKEVFETPQERILALVVELRRGTGRTMTAELTPEQLNREVKLPSPIADYVLHHIDPGEYSFRVATIRQSGSKEGEWKTKTSQSLWIVSSEIS